VAIGFDSSAVVVSGVTPGGQAVLFGLTREVADYAETRVRWEEVVAADATGTARYDLGRAVAPQSIWVAVDLAVGASSASAPTGFVLVQGDFQGAGLLRGLPSVPDGIEGSRAFLEVLVVRPGAGGGAWGVSVGDGGAADEDGAADGSLQVSLANLRPVGASGAPPSSFAPGDTIVAIDPNAMQLTLVSVPGAQP
jgi:hypothetical protein